MNVFTAKSRIWFFSKPVQFLLSLPMTTLLTNLTSLANFKISFFLSKVIFSHEVRGSKTSIFYKFKKILS